MRFTAEVLAAGGGGHAVIVPREVAAGFASKRPPVLARVNGTDYPSRLMVYGGKSYLGLRKDLLKTIGAVAGDIVEIDLELDVERAEQPTSSPGSRAEPVDPPAPVEPVELSEALAADPAARAAYDALPRSHRAEYARWIGEGKRPETRTERTARTIRRLNDRD